MSKKRELSGQESLRMAPGAETRYYPRAYLKLAHLFNLNSNDLNEENQVIECSGDRNLSRGLKVKTMLSDLREDRKNNLFGVGIGAKSTLNPGQE